MPENDDGAGAIARLRPRVQRSFDPESLLLLLEDDDEDEPRPELRLLLLPDPSLRLPPLSRFFEDWLRELSDSDCDLFDRLAISGLL